MNSTNCLEQGAANVLGNYFPVIRLSDEGKIRKDSTEQGIRFLELYICKEYFNRNKTNRKGIIQRDRK